jgi:hypothetical protein
MTDTRISRVLPWWQRLLTRAAAVDRFLLVIDASHIIVQPRFNCPF